MRWSSLPTLAIVVLVAAPVAARPVPASASNASTSRSIWKYVRSPNVSEGELYDVAALDPQDAWAVGWVFSNGAFLTLTEHWDGTRWRRVPSPSTGDWNNLRGVAMVGPDDVWAVGFGQE